MVLKKQPSLALPQFKENTSPERFEYLAIEDAIAGYLDAINRRDARRAASFWSRRGEWRRKDGERVSGREKIERAIEESFEGEPRGTTITLNEVSIRLITPNVALEEGLAVVTPGQTKSDLTLQLALNKDGMIRGNLSVGLTDEVVQVQGSVDKETQRVAFKLIGKEDIVIEAGLYNLTEDVLTVMVHRGDNRQEERGLVRLQEGEDEK